MPLAPTSRWHNEVPGTRWFRADLHLHTLDDPPVDLPAGLTGSRTDPAVLAVYAEKFLDAAVERKIEVLALTPHAVAIEPGLSAAWTILETWLSRTQSSTGKAYRDLIYAVFPGFEPNFADGNKGIHLLFLFDPDVSKADYLNAFGAIMGARPAYDGPNLNATQTSPPDAFRELDDARGVGKGNYLVVAPHPLQLNGLLSRPGPYITDLAAGRIHAAELSHGKTLDEDIASNGKLRHAFERGRVALYHASDATCLGAPGAPPAKRELGHQFTVLKLAAPTLEALRQALLGRESRLRDPYFRNSEGHLALAADVPVPCPVARPWLRSVAVRGGTSFHRDQEFHFSPDLTCIIGGSMTGKSTLLDGLRLLCCGKDGMPDANTSVGKAVWARARDGFLSGNSAVTLESPALDASLPVEERSEFKFFTQGELKSLSEDDDGIEHLLFHLVPGRAPALLKQRAELREQDAELQTRAKQLAKLQEQVGEAEQKFKRTKDARQAMERFARAGTAALPPAQQDAARTEDFRRDVGASLASARELLAQLDSSRVPHVSGETVSSALSAAGRNPSAEIRLKTACSSLRQTVETLEALHEQAGQAWASAKRALADLTEKVQAALVATGGSAADLNEFDAFARAAQHYESFEAALHQKATQVEDVRGMLERRLKARDGLVAQHRQDVRGVCNDLQVRFDGGILVELREEGRKKPLEEWLLGLRTGGVTQWWNSDGKRKATGRAIREIAVAVGNGDTTEATRRCTAIGMSDAVARSFLELLAPWARQLEAQALRTPDRYQIMWVEAGEPKNLDDLSGGRKVAVLLSLLLDSDDTTPLFIDQPEDELDNRFLNETIIPALHRLKGKRQVVFATHNANIVVNGDADQVIALEATAQCGHVYAEGAIEDPAVREAIVRTLDGGQEAFALRRAKYGF